MTTSFAAAPIRAAADSVQVLSLQTGHSVILTFESLTRVAVGDGRIAGVVPVGTTQLIINGKAPGHTTIFIWTDGGRKRSTYEVSVSSQGLDDVARTLRAAINEPGVQVVAFNYNVIIRGTVADVAAYNRIDSILKRFQGIKFVETSGGGGGNFPIINAVSIAKPLGPLQDEIAALPGGRDLRVDADAKGNVIVSGSVRDATQEQNVLDRVKGLAGPYLSSDGKVVDRLGVDQTTQVDVKVYVLEVDDTASSTLGLQLQSAQQTTQGGQLTYAQSPSFSAVENPSQSGLPGKALTVGALTKVSFLEPTLNLLLAQGHAHLLSSPNLVTVPGQEATFLVGGQIPIPVSNGLGSVSISYKEFGVNLRVTPTLLGNGSVDSKINPEISSLDSADGVTINGFVVPALKTSRLSTEVITSSGESIVMGGLLQHTEQKTIQKIPLLADIPILGQLFRSTQYQKSDTDVVFVMTPTIVTR
jgi:pilus assembly protein CpaC